jgi:succinate dehydrogenase / fumarate reductase cytochrome b subunit
MSWLVTYVRSSIGAKHVMAVTGLLLILFVIVHMLGHFGMFAGRDAYNTYAHTLQSLGALKWIARGGLLVLAVVHVGAALRLVAINNAARPVAYAMYKPKRTTFAARTMRWTGLIVLAFIVYHLVHFTFGQIQPEYFHKLDPAGRYDAYSMYVRGFQNLGVYISYLVAMALLCIHLSHGTSSLFQSLGLRHPKYSPLLDKIGPLAGLLFFVGYMAPPTAVLLGVIKLPGA